MQDAGEGLAIDVEHLQRLLTISPTLRACLTRYAHYLSVAVSQSSLANAQGTIQERLARWLLMAQDRLADSDITLTHELLSLMLGVRRAGVTTALHQLEGHGFVTTARGAVRILDRPGLIGHSGGFYGVAEAEYERLFPSSPPLGSLSVED
jgi:CRP-like cAMP-binding protein